MTPTHEPPAPAAPAIEGEEMREALAWLIRSGLMTFGVRDEYRREAGYLIADALLAGPLAQLRSDLQAARDERDARVDGDAFFAECLAHRKALNRAEAAESNLTALAKMYGEACGELQRARLSADEGWNMAAKNQDAELVDYARAEAAESTASQLSARVRELEEALRRATEELEEIVSFTSTERCVLRRQEIASIHEVAVAARSALSSSETEKRDV